MASKQLDIVFCVFNVLLPSSIIAKYIVLNIYIFIKCALNLTIFETIKAIYFYPISSMRIISVSGSMPTCVCFMTYTNILQYWRHTIPYWYEIRCQKWKYKFLTEIHLLLYLLTLLLSLWYLVSPRNLDKMRYILLLATCAIFTVSGAPDSRYN